MPIMRSVASVTVLLLAVAQTARAEKVTLDKPVPVTQKKADKSKIAGRIIAYDEDGFDLRVRADAEPETVQWSELDTRTRYAIRKSLLSPKDAAAHVELGREMLGLEGGKEWSEKAFAVALKLDPTLKDTVAEIKKESAAQAPAKATAKVDDKDDAGPTTPKTGKGEGQGPGPKMDEGLNQTGPQTIGDIQKQFWGPQTPEQQAAAVAELKAFAEKTQKEMGKSLRLNETAYFLFYSDLDEREAKNWSSNLDGMYAELARLFQVEKKANIWRGKALVFVFRTASDYRRFQMTMHQTDPGESAGMCHTYGNGIVHVAFYRQEDELRFAHVLFHESAHGFLHRYRSHVHVPSWANEGLAEWIARKLLQEMRVSDEKLVREIQRREKEARYHAQLWIRQMGGIGDFFDAPHIDGWQYNIAEMMTTFLIGESQKNYVAFINGIKDGLTWEEALETKYKATKSAIVPAFGKWLQVKF
jgi:hypothetical protein